MFISKVGKTVYFDCDDTLLEWQSCNKDDQRAIKMSNENNFTFYKKTIDANIEALKEHANAGHIVVVWSKGGVAWAANIVKTLGLEDYVDVVLSKPDWYYDDMDAQYWLPERQFKT